MRASTDNEMKIKTPLLLLLVVTASLAPCFAADAGEILGIWLNQDKDAKIEIFKCGDKYCGKIVWLKEPNYPQDSKDGTPGTPKLDHKNPSPAAKKTPLMGLQIVNDLVPAGENAWKDGKIYDPKSGKTYNAKASLASPNELKLRGFIGFSLLGRTEKWTRGS